MDRIKQIIGRKYNMTINKWKTKTLVYSRDENTRTQVKTKDKSSKKYRYLHTWEVKSPKMEVAKKR
jgi:hypothetical protein